MNSAFVVCIHVRALATRTEVKSHAAAVRCYADVRASDNGVGATALLSRSKPRTLRSRASNEHISGLQLQPVKNMNEE